MLKIGTEVQLFTLGILLILKKTIMKKIYIFCACCRKYTRTKRKIFTKLSKLNKTSGLQNRFFKIMFFREKMKTLTLSLNQTNY